MNDRDRLPVAVLISGGGTTLKNLLDQVDRGLLKIEVRLVLSSTSQAGGLEHARRARIPTRVISRSATDSDEAYGEAVFAACRQAGIELVVMGGFLRFVPIPPDFENRVMNIHPGLIPAFCGKGFYGLRVHRAALEYGVKVSGCTVHFVDNQYDHGPIILQRVVPVYTHDTPQMLAARVFEQECRAYPEAVDLFARGRLQVVGRRVVILDP